MVLQGGAKEVTIGDDGVLRLQGCLCVPNVDGLREKILEEAHSSRYSINQGATKIYRDLRQHYWWRWMKKDIVECVARCLNCHQVKYEHQRPGGLLQQMGIMRFGKKGKLSPRFIGPFDVLRRVREVAYELALPPSLSGVHPVFHVSMLQRYHADRLHVLDFSTVQLDESLGYEEEPVAIVDRQVRRLWSKKISVVKF
ncbi:uncharacterized protein [Nicotiana tomentosiformis]|uniref:uncharacterized protein n=1 Tax=Nicotiana tomentosiformis TaxID=4098 RepID=UPI00388CD180